MEVKMLKNIAWLIRARLMSPLLEKILSEIEQLTSEKQLTVMEHLVERMKKHITQSQPKRKLADLKGMSPYPLLVEDAQTWISRTRRD
jgi:predicted nucleotidyltransferase